MPVTGAVNVVVTGLVVEVVSMTLERRSVPIEVRGVVVLRLTPLDAVRRVVRLVMSWHMERRLRRIHMTAVMASMVAATVNHMTVPSLSFTAKTEGECGCQGDDGQHFFGDRQHDWNLFSAGDFVNGLH